MNKKKIGIIILKITLTVITLLISLIVALYLSIYLSSSNIFRPLITCSTLLLPSLLLILIYSKKRIKILKWWGIIALIIFIGLGINVGINAYEESITIRNIINIDCYEYLPFTNDTKIAKLDHEASLKLHDNLPIIDGAAAVFPVYSAFVNAVYPNTVKLDDDTFKYTNTSKGYLALAEKDIDIFFGAFPSKEQIEYAIEKGTEFEYTEIGKEAFVFFVNKDNPVNSLTQEQIRKIYSGEITNWKDAGGKDEEIIAFQRNEGSGSQSMLKKFMGDTPLMKAPTKQVNDFMVGIIEQVSDYKNRSNSIGFSFRYYMEEIVQNPNVKILKIDGIEANIENIKNDNYPITSNLYAVTYKGNKNENVKKLIDWILSNEGQEIIEKTGYVGIK